MILGQLTLDFKPGMMVSIPPFIGSGFDRISGLFFLLALLVRLGFIRVKTHPMCFAGILLCVIRLNYAF